LIVVKNELVKLNPSDRHRPTKGFLLNRCHRTDSTG